MATNWLDLRMEPYRMCDVLLGCLSNNLEKGNYPQRHILLSGLLFTPTGKAMFPKGLRGKTGRLKACRDLASRAGESRPGEFRPASGHELRRGMGKLEGLSDSCGKLDFGLSPQCPSQANRVPLSSVLRMLDGHGSPRLFRKGTSEA